MDYLTIIIPCYNEEFRLPAEQYRRFLLLHAHRLVLVDDGSTDGTLVLLLQLQRMFPAQVSVLSLKQNLGKAEAVRQGMMQAAAQTDNGLIGFMDADLATPFEELDAFIHAFRYPRLEFVFGSRIARIGAAIQRYPARHYLGRVMATLVSNYLRLPVNDSQCGAKFFRARLARQLFIEPFVSRWLFDVEIFRRMQLLGKCIEDCALELPLHCWMDKGGSKLRLHDFVRLPWDFYRMMNHYQAKRNSLNVPLLYGDAG